MLEVELREDEDRNPKRPHGATEVVGCKVGD